MGRNQRDGVAGFLIILLLVAGLGAIHPEPDPWTVEAMGPLDPNNEYCEGVGLGPNNAVVDWMPTIPVNGAHTFDSCSLNGAFVQCHTSNPFGGIDEDADGATEEADSSCIVLIDTDLNGVCDSRGLQSLSGFEHNAPYQRVSYIQGGPVCAGWE